MKQLLFMAAMTLAGTIGVVYRPFWGVAVYYLFATLRPQYLWQWVLPECRVVALRCPRDRRRGNRRRSWAFSL